MIAMFMSGTLIDTDYGLIPIEKCINGVMVDTPEGKRRCIGTRTVKYYRGLKFHLILSNDKDVYCAGNAQVFLSDRDMINVGRVKEGQEIVGMNGMLKIEKKIYCFFQLPLVKIFIDSPDNRHFIAAGLLTR